ncbi:MAG: hypothetical protein ACOY3F_07500 [Bacillota bacterium]
MRVSRVPVEVLLAEMRPAEPDLRSAEEVADYLDRCVNGGCRTLGELKRAVRKARDALRQVVRKAGGA